MDNVLVRLGTKKIHKEFAKGHVEQAIGMDFNVLNVNQELMEG